MRAEPRPNEVFMHFKDKRYEIVTLAVDSETGEKQVVYRAMNAPYETYVRSLEMFMSEVDREKYPDASQHFRFVRENGEGEQAEQQYAGQKADIEAESLEECVLVPELLAFLEADGYGQKLEALHRAHHKVTDDMLTTMAISLDIQINDGDLEERYQALRKSLQTLQKYEKGRLR